MNAGGFNISYIYIERRFLLVCAHTNIHTHIECSVIRGQKRTWDPLELELQEVVSPDIGPGIPTGILYKNCMYS